MKEKAILFQVSKARHLTQMRAVAKRFDAEVVPFLPSKQALNTFKRLGLESDFPRYLSFAEFYEENAPHVRAMGTAAAANEIARFDQKWGIPTSAKLVYFDRFAEKMSDYQTQIVHMLLWMRFVDHAITSMNPWFFHPGGQHEFYQCVLEYAFGVNGIPYLCPRGSILSGRHVYADGTNHITGWREAYARYKDDPRLLNDENGHPALQWLDEFRSRPQRPEYTKTFTLEKLSIRRAVRDWSVALRNIFDIGLGRYIFDYNSIDRELGFRGAPMEEIYNEYIVWYLRRTYQRMRKVYTENPDLSAKFIYFPLQHHPEVTTGAYGGGYGDQLSLVKRLAAGIPSDMALYVKEHTSMVGRRPNDFYAGLKTLYNVVLVHPSVSTFDLTLNCQAVATINSTAGWEAFLLGKPVVVFGHAIYDEYPNVMTTEVTRDFPIRLKKYLAEFQPDLFEIRASLAAYFDVNYPGEIASNFDFGYLASAEGREKNAESLCNAIEKQLAHWEGVYSGASAQTSR